MYRKMEERELQEGDRVWDAAIRGIEEAKSRDEARHETRGKRDSTARDDKRDETRWLRGRETGETRQGTRNEERDTR